MPIHDWTRVEAGVFHHFHSTWVPQLAAYLNGGLLPSDCYAMAEQIASGLGPDVLTLGVPESNGHPSPEPSGGVALATLAPAVRFRIQPEAEQYATKAKSVAIRHTSGHKILAVIEIVSPGNKESRHAIRSFVQKAIEFLRAGIHLLIVDLFPPNARNPQGIHRVIWDEMFESDFALPEGMPLTLVGYRADKPPEAFVEPTAVGLELAEMPLFLSLDAYVPLPLEPSYQAAWDTMPAFWRGVVDGSRDFPGVSTLPDA